MTKKLLLLLFLLIFISAKCFSQTIKFKDERLFKSIIDQGIDKNNNGQIEVIEARSVTILQLDEQNISNLSGLEYFKNIKELNLRKNNISDFRILNTLTDIEKLVIGDNKKTDSLDLSNLRNLKGLYAFDLFLKSIQFGSAKLIDLYLQGNSFYSFNTDNFPSLRTLMLDDNKHLQKVDLSKNTVLRQLYLLGTRITELNVSKNQNLSVLYTESSVVVIKNKNQKKLNPMPIIYEN